MYLQLRFILVVKWRGCNANMHATAYRTNDAGCSDATHLVGGALHHNKSETIDPTCAHATHPPVATLRHPKSPQLGAWDHGCG
jgi:hypothetical protein